MLQERHISVWNNCLNFIQQNIDPKQFNLWFRSIKPVSLVESTLTVEVPSEFFREYVEDTYLDILKAAMKKELGVGAKLVYRLRHQTQMPHHGDACCKDAPYGGQYLLATFELERVGMGDLHHVDGIVHRLDVATLVSTEGHVYHHESTLHGLHHRLAMIDHLVEGDGEGGHVTCHDIGCRVAYKDDVDACTVDERGHGEVI